VGGDAVGLGPAFGGSRSRASVVSSSGPQPFMAAWSRAASRPGCGVSCRCLGRCLLIASVFSISVSVHSIIGYVLWVGSGRDGPGRGDQVPPMTPDGGGESGTRSGGRSGSPVLPMLSGGPFVVQFKEPIHDFRPVPSWGVGHGIVTVVVIQPRK
jgi:hypothetical protein